MSSHLDYSGFLFIALALGCFALSAIPKASGVVPAPDGGYPGFNTAEGQNALLHLTTGTANTALGWFSLKSVITASFNTGVGAGTLVLNSGDQNTATGAAALLLNTTGSYNTATGAVALLNNTEGYFNTAIGWQSLYHNTTGNSNTALGLSAGLNLTTGSGNVCIGAGTFGVAGESDTTRIRNIYASVANGRAVYVDSDDKIGTLASSRRFKQGD